MALAGIELRYLVNQISEQVQGYYISNIYGITKRQYSIQTSSYRKKRSLYDDINVW